MTAKEETAITTAPPEHVLTGRIGVPRMLISLEDAKQLLSDFVRLKEQIILADPNNYVKSTRSVKQADGSYKQEPYTYIKKPGWQLIDTFFGISHQKMEKFMEIHEGAGFFDEQFKIPHFTYHVKYRTFQPDGRYVEHEGACSTMEKRFMGKDGKGTKYKDDYGAGKIFHDTEATAETRATNRGTSHIIGTGDVSAEEADAELEAPPALTDKEKAAKDAAKNMAKPEIKIVDGKVLCPDCNGRFPNYDAMTAHRKEAHK